MSQPNTPPTIVPAAVPMYRRPKGTWRSNSHAVGGPMIAPIGAIIGPPTAWLLLRHVPLGRLFMGTAAGTIVGGVFGWLIPSTESLDQPMNALLCAFCGFL